MKFSKIAVIALLSVSAAACTQVDNGTRGVEVTNGRADTVHKEGLVWYMPGVTEIVQIDVKTQKWTSETVAYTKDVQQAGIKFSMNYNLDPGKVMETYKAVGEAWDEKLVPQVVEQSIKNVFGQSEAVKDAINNRGVVQQRIFDEIRTKLAKKHITVTGFEIQNIDFSDAFEKAVEAKQVAVENANAATNRTKQVQEEAKQRLLAAEADAKAISNKAQALSQNPRYADLEWIAAWKATGGKVPTTVVTSGGAMPFLPMPPRQ